MAKIKLNSSEIDSFEQRYRTTFINSLAGFRQVVLVGTRSTLGTSNLAIFNSITHVGAHPPLYGLLVRPDSVQRDTLRNILDTNSYTFNFVDASAYQKAHQTSARYDESISEFEQVGLHEEWLEGCESPFVKDAIVKIEMKLEEVIPIALNGTKFIVGSVVHVEMLHNLIGNDGFVSLSDQDVLICQGLDAYFKPTLIGRLPYAKP